MKRYIIYAGVNGAGKSTLYYTSAHKNIRALPRINTDEMVHKMGEWQDAQLQMKAGKEAVKRIKEYFAKGISFSQETTLCGHSIIKNIQQAKELGYKVEMYYVGVADAQTAIERVANRVKNGGHGIPDEVIKKRYSQSLENLAKVMQLCDQAIIFDNTEHFLRFAVYERGKAVSLDENIMPQWFKQYDILNNI